MRCMCSQYHHFKNIVCVCLMLFNCLIATYMNRFHYTCFSVSKASFTLSWFSVSASCGHRGPSGSHRSDAGKHRIESGYTVLNRRSPESGPGGFNLFNNLDSSVGTMLRNNAGLYRGITVYIALPA